MSYVPQELIEEARKRGIVPGAVIQCAVVDRKCTGTVRPIDKWEVSSGGTLWVGFDYAGSGLGARTQSNHWATVITTAPSVKEEEGLKEGDAVECGPAMRAAIVELARQLGLSIHESGVEDIDTWPNLSWFGALGGCKDPNLRGSAVRHTPEAFIAKMRVTAKLPKPEPPIKIDGYEVKYEAGYIKVGCQPIPNATVRAIAEKLID